MSSSRETNNATPAPDAPATPAVAQPSATVLLLDPNRGEPFALFLLERAGSSRFMAGRFVFPGGRVEASDGEDPTSLEVLGACALRELWEEAGVILDPGCRAARIPLERREAARQKLMAGEVGLVEALAGLGLEPGLDRLVPLTRWITPEFRPIRFDTVFFMARMPSGQEANCDHTETCSGRWLTPAEAIAANKTGEIALAPPQVRILGELASFDSMDAVLASGPSVKSLADLEPVRPIIIKEESGRVMLLPWDPDYADGRVVHGSTPCPAGQASRILHLDGLWRPHQAEA